MEVDSFPAQKGLQFGLLSEGSPGHQAFGFSYPTPENVFVHNLHTFAYAVTGLSITCGKHIFLTRVLSA